METAYLYRMIYSEFCAPTYYFSLSDQREEIIRAFNDNRETLWKVGYFQEYSEAASDMLENVEDFNGLHIEFDVIDLNEEEDND